MKVAVLYSGGKDSTYAIEFAKEKGWDVRYLISVKPARKDCFLFHYATVEHTPKIAEVLGIRHVLLSCDVADPVKEAEIVKNAVKEQQTHDPVEAVILGGTGLQETQIRSVQNALKPLKIEVFAAHSGLEHDEVMRKMIDKGYEFIISQVASDGLMPWLGMRITRSNLQMLFEHAKKFGFHQGGEGGYYDSFVVAGPLLGDKEIIPEDMEKVIEDRYCGHIVIKKLVVKNESLIPGHQISAFE